MWGGCLPLCPVGRGPQAVWGVVRAFQGAQDHPQISATCQEGLGDCRGPLGQVLGPFSGLVLKTNPSRAPALSQGLQVRSCKKALHLPQPWEEGPVTGPIWQRKQGRPRGVR